MKPLSRLSAWFYDYPDFNVTDQEFAVLLAGGGLVIARERTPVGRGTLTLEDTMFPPRGEVPAARD
jgi:hypothetical protein